MTPGLRSVAIALACACFAAGAVTGYWSEDLIPRLGADSGGSAAGDASEQEATGESRVYESESAGRVMVPASYPHPETVGLAGVGVDPDDLPEWEGPTTVGPDDMPGDGTPLVIEGYRLERLKVSGHGAEVICRRCHIGPGSSNSGVEGENGGAVTVEDSTVDYEREGRAVRGRNVTVRRSVVTGGSTVMNLSSGSRVVESFIADPAPGISGAHYDIIQTNSADGLVITGNTVLGRWQSQTSALFLQGNARWDGLSDVIVEGNFLSGGNYTMYLVADDESPPVSAAVVRDNVWNAGSWQYGPLRQHHVASDLIWEDNRTTDGEPVD